MYLIEIHMLLKNKIIPIFLLSSVMFYIQGCSAPNANEIENLNSNKSKSKVFGDRFSIENIKKEREAYYAQKISELNNLSPSTEVQKALQSNSPYFMATADGKGTTLSIPGLIDPKIQPINCKTVAVEGMGDVLYGKNHLVYRQQMLSYMSEFNSLMSQYCK